MVDPVKVERLKAADEAYFLAVSLLSTLQVALQDLRTKLEAAGASVAEPPAIEFPPEQDRRGPFLPNDSGRRGPREFNDSLAHSHMHHLIFKEGISAQAAAQRVVAAGNGVVAHWRGGEAAAIERLSKGFQDGRDMFDPERQAAAASRLDAAHAAMEQAGLSQNPWNAVGAFTSRHPYSLRSAAAECERLADAMEGLVPILSDDLGSFFPGDPQAPRKQRRKPAQAKMRVISGKSPAK
jgi:hypothetical protein